MIETILKVDGMMCGMCESHVNDAVRNALAEDQEDLAAFEDRAAEPLLSYEELLNDLKAHGQI